LLTSWWPGSRVRKTGRGRASSSLQWHTSNDLLPLARPHLLKFLEAPKLVPAAGDQALNTWAYGDTSYPNHNRALPLIECTPVCLIFPKSPVQWRSS
jgi:hypothetical protein